MSHRLRISAKVYSTRLSQVLCVVGWGWLLSCGYAQAPLPRMAPSGSSSVLLEYAPPGTPVPVERVTALEDALATLARRDARRIATTYAEWAPPRLRGVPAFGRRLVDELAKTDAQFDFQGVVSHNPEFWQAERELAPDDVSLPYLVSMLAILSRDYVTATRLISLAQATLPLTPTLRSGYARPETMMLYLDALLLAGVPLSTQMQSVEQCDAGIATLRKRIAKWSNRPGLLRALIELETRRVELLTQAGRHPEILRQPMRELLNLTREDLAFARRNDPILAAGFDANVQQWLDKSTLAQRWSRWIEYGDPATTTDVEASVMACANNGRPDLAWLVWRAEVLLRGGIISPEEQQRWKQWCDQLLDAGSSKYVEETTTANRLIGLTAIPVEHEDYSEAWSGDLRIHPLFAIKIEREIAVFDTMLAVLPPGTSGEGTYRLRRAELLSTIDAVEPSRRELRRVQQIIHFSERTRLPNGITIMDWIRVIEARLLDTEGHYADAEALYEKLIHNPNLDGLQRNFLAHLFIAGTLERAHSEYAAFARAHPTDTYRSIMADLTARRLGLREIDLLQSARHSVTPDSWVENGIRFLLGELTEEELMARARQGPALDGLDHECEATFWIAEVALGAGRKEDGIKWLNRCVATGFMQDVELKIAKAELKRLIPEPDPKSRKAPENSRGSVTT